MAHNKLGIKYIIIYFKMSERRLGEKALFYAKIRPTKLVEVQICLVHELNYGFISVLCVNLNSCK